MADFSQRCRCPLDLRLETSRLWLRIPVLEDLDDWTGLMADIDVARYIGGVMPRSVVWRQIITMIGGWHACGFSMFSVIEKDTGRWVGRVGPWRPEGWPGTEIGWAIVRDRWGLGYATESATAATNWAVSQLGWTDIIHSIAPQNVASQRVAMRLGASNRGPGRLPAPLQDEAIDIWGQTREQWHARQVSA
jgi:RimJ/RimL family protein N-acetyltransferase